MTRVVVEEFDARERAARHKEVLAGSRERGMRFGCGGLVLAALVIIGAAVAVAVARTGIVSVPVATDLLYRPATPVREVLPLAGYSEADIIAGVAARTVVNRASGTVTVSFTETELTTIASRALASAEKDLPFPIERAQVAIGADAIEVFALLPRDGRDVPLIVALSPELSDGRLHLRAERVVVGSLPVPKVLATVLTDIVEHTALGNVQRTIADIGTLDAIRLREGKLEVTIRP